jgi:hypothetical protein
VEGKANIRFQKSGELLAQMISFGQEDVSAMSSFLMVKFLHCFHSRKGTLESNASGRCGNKTSPKIHGGQPSVADTIRA